MVHRAVSPKSERRDIPKFMTSHNKLGIAEVGEHNEACIALHHHTGSDGDRHPKAHNFAESNGDPARSLASLLLLLIERAMGPAPHQHICDVGKPGRCVRGSAPFVFVRAQESLCS